MIIIKEKIHARIWFKTSNLTSPCFIEVSKERLKLEINYHFTFFTENIKIELYPEDIIDTTIPSGIFFWGRSIQIFHKRTDYDKKIILIPINGGAPDLLNKIDQTGFLEKSKLLSKIVKNDEKLKMKYTKIERFNRFFIVFSLIISVLFVIIYFLR